MRAVYHGNLLEQRYRTRSGPATGSPTGTARGTLLRGQGQNQKDSAGIVGGGVFGGFSASGEGRRASVPAETSGSWR